MKQLDFAEILQKEFLKNVVEIKETSLISKVKNQYQKPVTIRRYLNFDTEVFYSIGLWMGDKYVFGGSVGLTNTNQDLIEHFEAFLRKLVRNKNRIQQKSINDGKARRVYVNSWLVLRLLQTISQKIQGLINEEGELIAYISGKVDADGTIMPQNWYSRTGFIKITYGNKIEAENDKKLFEKFGFKGVLIPYKDRNALDLKFTLKSSLLLLDKLSLKDDEKQAKIVILRGLIGR